MFRRWWCGSRKAATRPDRIGVARDWLRLQGGACEVATTEDAKAIGQIGLELGKHFANHPVYADLEGVLESFIAELRQG